MKANRGFTWVELATIIAIIAVIAAIAIPNLIKANNVKECPACAEPIKKKALKCKHCGTIQKKTSFKRDWK